MATPEGMNPEDFQKLLKMYKESIPEKIKTMKEHLEALKKNPSLEVLKNLRLIIHKTAGNAGTFGYQMVTDLCIKWDQRLSKMIESFDSKELSPQLLEEISQLISSVEKEFQK